MGPATIPAPDPGALLAYFLPALPSAAVSVRPTPAMLHLLAPVLRQRVQILSSSSSKPWLRFLCYDPVKAKQLVTLAQSPRLEPHPVSGEVDVDWLTGTTVSYRRLDPETLHAHVVILDLELVFRLVYCGPEDDSAWRVGEVTVADGLSTSSISQGFPTVQLAEEAYETAVRQPQTATVDRNISFRSQQADGEPQDDDDGYWDRYDTNPPRHFAAQHSKAVESTRCAFVDQKEVNSADDAYYAQYDTVQLALDSHDPDEEANMASVYHMSQHPHSELKDYHRQAATLSPLLEEDEGREGEEVEEEQKILPDRSIGRQGQSELELRQHISFTIRNLSVLARESGLKRNEFERLVRINLAAAW